MLVFPHTTFLRNAKSYPVLSKAHQQYLSLFARLRFPPWMLLSDVGNLPGSTSSPSASPSPSPTPAEASSLSKEKRKDPVPHLSYVRHLQHSQPPRSPIERFGQGYQDFLQSPLQPLADNLESVTYEVFEKDPVKYEWYERAIAAALKDLRDKVEVITVAVVGAGRGPLVTRALQASQKTGIRIDCWAVEKNPNAFVLLQRRNATDPLWNHKVHVDKSDMRHWRGPRRGDEIGTVDILVSELLGSFADNELSPECLDGVQQFLHPEHGVSIPQSYSAHLTPISTSRIHSDLLSRSGADKWDIPYVVMLHQLDFLCTTGGDPEKQLPDVKEAWSFSHPIPAEILEYSRVRAGGSAGASGWVGGDGGNEHNSRSCRLNFTSSHQSVCHGLGGYFETVLYDGPAGKVELSTNPVTMEQKSKDMISWFPIFFPIKVRFPFPKGIIQSWLIDIYRSRCSFQRAQKLWYICGDRPTIVACGMSGWLRFSI
jgi:type II protein arginine methyltransferase